MIREDEGPSESYQDTITFSSQDLAEFAAISGDYNPLHLKDEFAIAQGFKSRIVHGALVISKVSGIIASKFPGAGTIIGSIEWKFVLPVFIDQDLELLFTLKRTHTKKGILNLKVIDDNGQVVQEARMIVFVGN